MTTWAGRSLRAKASRVLGTALADTGVRILAVDPGEMDTKMHADAVPDAERATLQRPADVARRIVEMIEDDVRATSGARLAVPSWEVKS